MAHRFRQSNCDTWAAGPFSCPCKLPPAAATATVGHCYIRFSGVRLDYVNGGHTRIHPLYYTSITSFTIMTLTNKKIEGLIPQASDCISKGSSPINTLNVSIYMGFFFYSFQISNCYAQYYVLCFFFEVKRLKLI